MDSSKKVIILETNPPSPIFDDKPAYASWFVESLSKFDRDIKIKSYNVFADKFPRSLKNVNGVIITGSSKEVYDNEPWIRKLAILMKKIKTKRIPLLGVCFGYQLIAQVFGGKVAKNTKGREIGTCVISLLKNAMNDDLFKGLSTNIKVQESHISRVMELPQNSISLAENEYGNQAFRLLNENIWGVQFHPEVTSDNLKKVINFRQNILLNEGLDVRKIYAEVTPTPDAQKILFNFLNIIYANS